MFNRVLVTGGSGFIGSHVCMELVERGIQPIVFDRHKDHTYPYEVILGDVRDDVSVTEAVAHVDGVIHLAAVLGTQETIANPRPAILTNVLGSANVFSAIAQYGLPAVYIAVGNHWMNNTYSISKTTAERFALMSNKENGTKIAVVRALNAYGPGQRPIAPWGSSKVRKIMPAFVCKALADEPIEIYGDGSQIMDMIYVTDVAKVLVDALVKDHGIYDCIFEAGSGQATSVNDIADEVINAVGAGSIEYVPMRPGEPESSVVLGDPSTLSPLGINEIDFMSLELGISRTVDFFKDTYFS